MRKPRVFICSVISGLEKVRDTAKSVILKLHCEPLTSESVFGLPASEIASPQRTCLLGVERSDIVLGLLGPKYGDIQKSGLSAPHEELRHALRLGKHILLFKTTQELEERQQELIAEIGCWETGQWIHPVDFGNESDLKTKISLRLSELVKDIDPNKLIDTTLTDREAKRAFRNAAGRGSAPCNAFLAGDWSVLKTKKAFLIPLNLRVRVAITTFKSRENRVRLYYRSRMPSTSGSKWAYDRRYSNKLSSVIKNTLEDSLLSTKKFPSLPRCIDAVAFSDVEFGSALHEDAAFCLALAAALQELCQFNKSQTLSLAGLFLSNWYAHISWATLVCSFEQTPPGLPLVYFDRTNDGGIDLEDVTSKQYRSRDYKRNALLSRKKWKIKHYSFGLDKISVWCGEKTFIDIDESPVRYADSLSQLNVSLANSIIEEMKTKITRGGPKIYNDLGLLMNMHHEVLTLAGFVDDAYDRLIRNIMGQPGVLGAKPCGARGKGAIIVLTETPLTGSDALVEFMHGHGLKPLLLQNQNVRGTLSGTQLW